MSDYRIISESWAVLVNDAPPLINESTSFIALLRDKAEAETLMEQSYASKSVVRVARVRVVEVRDE